MPLAELSSSVKWEISLESLLSLVSLRQWQWKAGVEDVVPQARVQVEAYHYGSVTFGRSPKLVFSPVDNSWP